MRIHWLGLFTLASALAAQEKVSRPGFYQGYSQPTYDGWKRTSQYLTMRDGVRLAIDIYRPTRNGVLHTEKLPVIWSHVRYHRSEMIADTISPYFALHGRGSDVLIKYGYVVVSVDTRGGGASFGTQQGFFSPEETRDSYEVTEWLAAQPWSTGNIGMVGRSYLGIVQYFAASQRPPHLKAIFPEMAVFEWYPFIYPGGIYRDDFFSSWSKLTQTLDRSGHDQWFAFKLSSVAPVDGSAGLAQRDSAIQVHAQNRDINAMWAASPYRNSKDPVTGRQLFMERSPSTVLSDINRSGVAIYTWAGWNDAFPRDALLWYANLTVPQKLLIGPWFHTERNTLDLYLERVRWFDYWLKGIDNGIMSEAPINYIVIGAPADSAWRSTRIWPPTNTRTTLYYLAAGKSGSSSSKNDGRLVRSSPKDAVAADSMVADQSASLGPGNRWANTYGGQLGYPDLSNNDSKGFTYTTDPLEQPVEVIGSPILHLWVRSSSRDADFFAYVEEVDPSGKSSYVTEGALRASHRRLAQPPYKNYRLPWTRSWDVDRLELPVQPTDLVFDLHPTARRFAKGNRIRLTITNADRDSHRAPYPTVPPMITIHRDRVRASNLVLPIVRQ